MVVTNLRWLAWERRRNQSGVGTDNRWQSSITQNYIVVEGATPGTVGTEPIYKRHAISYTYARVWRVNILKRASHSAPRSILASFANEL